MPVIKSAIKKLRKDIKRTKANDLFKHELEMALRNAKKAKSAKAVSNAVSYVDRAVKKNLIHKNRAARVKSSLSKLARPLTLKRSDSERAKPATKTVKTTTKAASKTTTKIAKTPTKKSPPKAKSSKK